MKKKNGTLIAFLDIVTFGLYLFFYMFPLQKEIESITKKKYVPYQLIFLLGLFTFIIPNVIWISRVAEDLKNVALEKHIEGKLTSFKHMFYWNIPGFLIVVGPFIATYRFFDTLNKIEEK